MICPLCSMCITGEKRKLIIKADTIYLHKTCLRKATQEELIKKGLIRPDDKSWWTKL